MLSNLEHFWHIRNPSNSTVTFQRCRMSCVKWIHGRIERVLILYFVARTALTFTVRPSSRCLIPLPSPRRQHQQPDRPSQLAGCVVYVCGLYVCVSWVFPRRLTSVRLLVSAVCCWTSVSRSLRRTKWKSWTLQRDRSWLMKLLLWVIACDIIPSCHVTSWHVM